MRVLHGFATSMPFALFEETIARNLIDQGLSKALWILRTVVQKLEEAAAGERDVFSRLPRGFVLLPS